MIVQCKRCRNPQACRQQALVGLGGKGLAGPGGVHARDGSLIREGRIQPQVRVWMPPPDGIAMVLPKSPEREETSIDEINILGVGLAKHVFQVHGGGGL